jgi:hypothetical protein
MITQLPILYLKKTGSFVVENRLSTYEKAYSFTNITEFDNLVQIHKQNYFYTIEPTLYFNSFWDQYFLTKTSKNAMSVNYKYNIKPYCIYFPQFHTFQENNRTFYNGFTDTTNLALLKEENPTHYTETPNMDELGINSTDITLYNLENASIIQKQIDMITDYNIQGFGIYYYWFSTNSITNQNMIMEKVINQFFTDSIQMKGRKVFLIWANEDWSRNPAFGQSNEKIENEYNDDHYQHNINQLLTYFHHDHYLKIDNRPVFFLHHPWFMNKTQLDRFHEVLASRCVTEGFDGVHFIVNSMMETKPGYINYHINFNYKHAATPDPETGRPIINYKRYFDQYNNDSTIQTLVLDFDNTARLTKPNRAHLATICKGNTEFEQMMAIRKITEMYNRPHTSEVEKIMLINAWNEWGEKMNIEPSKEYGYYYLNLLQSYMK